MYVGASCSSTIPGGLKVVQLFISRKEKQDGGVNHFSEVPNITFRKWNRRFTGTGHTIRKGEIEKDQ